jgi:alpha-D-ribose 1-methylphosphonate 5-phosphate C-P lyase
MLDGTYDTLDIIQNTGSTISFSENMANFKTNVNAFNQSKFFKKSAVSLTECQLEINGIPQYPFPQPLHLIKNNNFEALEMEGDKTVGDFVGFQSLESWSKFGFLMATSYEFPNAWKNGIVSGYPNPTGNLLTIKYSTTFSATAEKVYLLAFAERVVRANFNGGAVSIDY